MGESYSCASGGVIAGGRWSSALATFASSVGIGEYAQFPSPSLLVADSSGSRPFVPTPESGSDVGMFDWLSNLPYDPISRRIFAAGGRPATSYLAQKLTWYDAKLNLWDSIGNPFGSAGGHIYDSHTVASNIRRFFHKPFYSQPWVNAIHEWDIDAWSKSRTIEIPHYSLTGDGGGWGGPFGIAWHPNLGSQGSLLLFTGATTSKIARLDWATQAWSGILGSSDDYMVDGHIGAIYIPHANAVIGGKSDPARQRPLYIVDASGALRESAVCPCGFGPSSSSRAFFSEHPSRDALITFTRGNGWPIHTYEFSTDTWVQRGVVPVNLQFVNTAATCIPELGVVLITTGYGNTSASATHVYRPEF